MLEKEDAFGFGSIGTSTKDKIRQIKPSSPPDLPSNMAAVDAAAQNAGFISREAPLASYDSPYRAMKVQRAEPRIPLNLRIPVSVGGAFQRFCDENRYSYPEGLAEIMRRAGLPLK